MLYHVCVQNCYQDFYYENDYCGKFETYEDAIAYIQSPLFAPPVFDVTGYIKWYFPDCDSDGNVRDPNSSRDILPRILFRSGESGHYLRRHYPANSIRHTE